MKFILCIFRFPTFGANFPHSNYKQRMAENITAEFNVLVEKLGEDTHIKRKQQVFGLSDSTTVPQSLYVYIFMCNIS